MVHSLKAKDTLREERHAPDTLFQAARSMLRVRTIPEIRESETAGIRVVTNAKDATLIALESALVDDPHARFLLLQKAEAHYGTARSNVGEMGNTTMVVKKTLVKALDREMEVVGGEKAKLGRFAASDSAEEDVDALLGRIMADGSESHLAERRRTRKWESIKAGLLVVAAEIGAAASLYGALAVSTLRDYREGLFGAFAGLLAGGYIPALKSYREYIKWTTDKKLNSVPEADRKEAEDALLRNGNAALADAKDGALTGMEALLIHDPAKKFLALMEADEFYKKALGGVDDMHAYSRDARRRFRRMIEHQRRILADELDLLDLHLLKDALYRHKGKISISTNIRVLKLEEYSEEMRGILAGEAVPSILSDSLKWRAVGASIVAASSGGPVFAFTSAADNRERFLAATFVFVGLGLERFKKAREERTLWEVDRIALDRWTARMEVAHPQTA